MIRTVLLAAALALPLPAAASEWMGSFYGVGGGFNGGFTSTWQHGKIRGDLTSLFYGTTDQNIGALPFKGTYSVKPNGQVSGKITNIPYFGGKFTGWRGNGQMNGSFKNGGHFDATRTSKGKK
jgi:hypothetical protein